MADYSMDLRKLVGTRPLIMCGANVILLNDKDEILLHHRVDNDCWGLPGGMMELRETLDETARREVFEEVGLTCGDMKLFNVYSGERLYHKYPNGDEVYNVTATYICRDYSGKIVVDLNEGKDARFFPLDRIPSNLSGPIKVTIEEFLSKFSELKKNNYKNI